MPEPNLIDSEITYDVLSDESNRGSCVTMVNVEDDHAVFLLSSGFSFALFLDDSYVSQIGLDGYRYHYLTKVDDSWMEPEPCELEGVFYLDGRKDSSGSLLAAVERYKDWIFMFTDGNHIILTKSVFQFDFDAIIKTINHRGYSCAAPENTLPAFRLARLNGFSYVETDVRFTSDGVPVLIHDSKVDRTSNGSGEVSEMTYKELLELDFGSWFGNSYKGTKIPSFCEFLHLCSDIGLSPYIELKEGDFNQISQLVEMVRDHGLAERTVFTSYGAQLLKYVLRADPKAHIGLISSRVDSALVTKALSLENGDNTVEIWTSDKSVEASQLCLENNVAYYVGTIDNIASLLGLPKGFSGVGSNSLLVGKALYEIGEADSYRRIK